MKIRQLYSDSHYGYRAEYIIVPDDQTEEDVILHGCRLDTNEEINKLRMKLAAMAEFPEYLLEETHRELNFGEKGYFTPYICMNESGFVVKQAYDD